MLVHDQKEYFPSVDTFLSGILGKPLDHTLSPAMHMTAFRKKGIDALFIPFAIEEEELELVLKAASAMRFIGFSVTMPYKKTLIPYLDELDESARFCGAVNVIAVRDGKLIGYNTDGLGFVQGMIDRNNYDPRGKRFILLGSGGSSRAIAFALAKAGAARIDILNRAPREKNAHTLAADVNEYLHGICWGGTLNDATMATLLRESNCVINTTPAGMDHVKEKTAFDINLLEPHHLVCDIVYKPNITPMLAHAQKIGCNILEGYWMLVYQGVLAWRFWTNREDAPIAEMAEIVKTKLQ